MKKILALLLATAMCLSMLTACGSSTDKTSDASDTSVPETVETAGNAETAGDASELTTVTAGKLTVATSPDFAPYEFYSIAEDGTPTLSGFDMDLAQYIADYLGLDLEIVTVDFDGVLSELSSKSVDLGMAGLSPDPARENIMDFSDIYYQGGQSFVTVEDKKDVITSMEVANSSDYTIGAQTGSIQLDLANENTPDANIVSMPKVTDIISELIAGKEDGAFIETDVAKCYQKNYPELVIVCNVPYDTEGSAIGVCKGNDALRAAVNEAIAAAVADGSLNNFVAAANELATGEKYEGLLVDGQLPGSTEGDVDTADTSAE